MARTRLLVAPRGPIGAITDILLDGWCRVIFPFAHSVRFRRHERPLIEANQPLN